MRDFLTSGKILMGVLAIGLFVLAGVPLVEGQTAEVLIRGLSFLGLFCFFAFTTTWQRRAFSELKKSGQLIANAVQALESRNRVLEQTVASLRHEIADELPGKLEPMVRDSSVAGAERVEKVVGSAEKNIVVSLGRIGRTQGEMSKQLDRCEKTTPKKVAEAVQKAGEQSMRMESDPVGQKSIYNLSMIPPMKVLKSNTSGALGRSAAMIEVEGDSTEPLRRLQSMGAENWRPNVAAIARPALNRSISNSSNLAEVLPNQAASYADRPLDFVVVDESVFTEGVWSGALETYKLQTFMDLELFINKSKNSGAVIIVVKSEKHYAMTNSLRDMADVLVHPDGVARAHDGNMINLALCETIIAATNSEKEHDD